MAVVNPTLIVELVSPATEEYDRGDKFEHYKRLPSLREYVLVSHRDRKADIWTRGEDGWTCGVARPGEPAELTSIGARLDVTELLGS